MSIQQNPPVEPDNPIVELVAYLDGEVDQEQQQAIEQRLAADPSYRDELIRLQRCWDLLDQLPRSDTDEAFTKSTISMAVLQVEAGNGAAAGAASRRWRRTMWAVGAAAAAAAGFAMVAIPMEQSRRARLRDVPVIENVDLYRYADSVDFLRLLDNEKLFPDDEDVL